MRTDLEVEFTPLGVDATVPEGICPQRWELGKNKHGWLLRVTQQIKGEWHPTGGSWYLADLVKHPTDVVYIDFGQNWRASGMREATRLAASKALQPDFSALFAQKGVSRV